MKNEICASAVRKYVNFYELFGKPGSMSLPGFYGGIDFYELAVKTGP